MATIINADTSNGLKFTSDTSGEIELQSAGTTKAKITSSGITDASGQLLSNTPAFSINISAAQTLAETTITKLQFDTVVFDTDSVFDTSNYSFTVPSGKAGYYQINAKARFDSEASSNLNRAIFYIYKNGSQHTRSYDYFTSNPIRAINPSMSNILDLEVGDVIELYGYIDSVDNTGGEVNSTVNSSFSVFKLIT